LADRVGDKGPELDIGFMGEPVLLAAQRVLPFAERILLAAQHILLLA
jgi:hypothetical protein